MPAVETLEKFARALEMPLYQLMYDGSEPPVLPPKGRGQRSDEWGSAGRDARFLNKLCRFLAEMNADDRQLLLSFAENVIKKQRRAGAKIKATYRLHTIDSVFDAPQCFPVLSDFFA